ncbi:MAG: AtpZ/AtpI family protein [Desulfobacterales bacterium]|nr:AtpZ/AtpI family protein [Desulfobacterales bacterium]
MIEFANKPFSYNKNRAWSETVSIVMQLGLTMAGCILGCFFAGRWLDQVLGLKGALTVLLTIFGIVGGATVAYGQIMEVIRDEPKKDDQPEPNDR